MENIEKIFTNENIEKIKSTMKEFLALFDPTNTFLDLLQEVIEAFNSLEE